LFCFFVFCLFKMKFVVLLAFIAAAFCQGNERSSNLKFEFKDNIDGYSFPNAIIFPLNFGGVVEVQFTKERKADAILCLHLVVPVVAPSRENLTSEFPIDKIWNSTCTPFLNVSHDDTGVNPLNLPSGEYFVTAALPYEYVDTNTSAVNSTDYDFGANFTWYECDDNFIGKNCKDSLTEIKLGENDANLTLGIAYFKLSTLSDRSDAFASNLTFDIQCEDKDVVFSTSPRLMGLPNAANNISLIENPPFTFTKGYDWIIAVSASKDSASKDSASKDEMSVKIIALMKYCPKGTIGANCTEFETLDNTTAGVVAKYDHNTTLVFDSTVSVAISGLMGHKKDTVGPDVNVQIDAAPSSDSTKNLLVSMGAVANVVTIDLSKITLAAGPTSKIVLTINPPNNKSFGIWVINDTTACPEGCGDHGVCSAAEYSCMCSSRYEDIDCGVKKSVSLEYIVLIAVVSVLVLAIVIGVPIYCYLNRSQEYDVVA